ncbi:hypothetical protein [Pantoea sp. Cy-639]|uniref:hypothetical protein n=1 Tax=Pantoea sp. Cy-639 TaxID=2608360 RepID=UPI00141E180C|nr:hypothetical protein [Pantoea sp. Cy-639]NIF19635.1 hypothetical protein [Pantoea sp. Cy-639]
MSPASLINAILVACMAGLFLGGCAQNADVRGGHDYTSGTTVKNPPDYLVCVQDELPSGSKVYLLNNSSAMDLYVDSTDPKKASGLVEVQGAGAQHKFTAYQRDAWYDRGRLLDAALLCART